MEKIRNKFIFGICTIASGAAAMFGINALPVIAAENVGEEMTVGNDVGTDAGINADGSANAARKLSENSRGGVNKSGNTAGNEDVGVYDFKDNKTNGTFTVTKVWNDCKTNEKRVIPDIKISTSKPSKSALGYTVTFHGNKAAGLVFDDGSDVNEVVYNSSGQIVDGAFKMPGGFAAGAVSWFTDKALTNKVDVSEDGVIQMALNGDVDLWIKTKTFEIKGYNGSYSKKYNDFSYLIPDTVTEIFFTDEIKPESASIIDVDADGDGGVVAWTENNGAVMKVSTQIEGIKVQAARKNGYMFYSRRKLTNIDFSMFDTAKVTNMGSMFYGCSGLISLDLTPLDTTKVTNMDSMFYNCSDLTILNLTSFNTTKVTNMYQMFYNCSGLTSLDLSSFNTANVKNMSEMFDFCSGLITLDLSPFDTQKVTNMSSMFNRCSGLTSLDLTPLDTKNVTNMSSMFSFCSGLTTLDLSPLDTQKVTNMSSMFDGCSGLTALDLSPLDTQNVTSMSGMFDDCSGLTALDLSPLDTQKVTYMSFMFSDCSGLTTLNLSTFDTQDVTNMGSMFNGCSGLTSLDLTSFNTTKVTNMSWMFNNCFNLISLDLSSFDTAKVTDMGNMFCECKRLTALDLTTFDTQNVTNMSSMFYSCNGLTNLITGPNFKFVGTNYDLPGTWKNTAGETFNGNYSTANFPSNVADTYTKISN